MLVRTPSSVGAWRDFSGASREIFRGETSSSNWDT